LVADSVAPGTLRVYALLVSNDPVTIEQLVQSLQQLATYTDVCTDIPKALQLVNQRKFEAVVVDLEMGKEARDVIERVRLSPSNRTTVTFAISASKNQTQMAYDAGSNFVLERPLSIALISGMLTAAYGLIIRERRRYFRCPTTIPAVIQKGSTPEEIRCQAVNLSEGGMAIATSVPLNPGARVSVQFTLPGQATEFTANSEICWNDEKGRTGLQFLALAPHQKSQLQEWLAYKLEEVLPESVARKFRKVSDSNP